MSRTSTQLLMCCFATALLLAAPGLRTTAQEKGTDQPATKAEAKKVETAKADPTSPTAWPKGEVVFLQSEEAKRIRAALEEPAEFDFLDTPLGDVVTFVEEKTKVNVELDPEALAADGKGSDVPVTKKGKFSSMANGLRLVLDGQGLTYLVKNDVLLITTKTAASAPENLSTRIYQVHDLVVAANDPTASKPDFDALIQLITTTVRQQDWQDNGGTIGFLHSFQGAGILALVATHEEQGHREIEQLLKMLRESRVQQVVDAQAKKPLTSPEQQQMGGMSGGIGAASVPPQSPNQVRGAGAGFF